MHQEAEPAYVLHISGFFYVLLYINNYKLHWIMCKPWTCIDEIVIIRKVYIATFSIGRHLQTLQGSDSSGCVQYLLPPPMHFGPPADSCSNIFHKLGVEYSQWPEVSNGPSFRTRASRKVSIHLLPFSRLRFLQSAPYTERVTFYCY